MFVIECEVMEYDVVIVGVGFVGLFVVICLKQLDVDLNVVVLEKGFEVGVYILLGVVLDLFGFDCLMFDWKVKGVLLNVLVIEDKFFVLGEVGLLCLLNVLMLLLMNNYGNYIVLMGNVCCWMVE